ncbi:MAG: leucine-rich repeat domain-containing protein [Clostridia bacterium]|nr:leucine-rich repeat domain-containing protein [Clostridia bacterium]
MADIEYPRVVSERSPREWIPGCPVQVKKLRLTRESAESGLSLTVFTTSCGDFGVESVTLDLSYQNERREHLGTDEGVTVKPGESAPVPVSYEKAAHPYAVVRAVKLSSGELWENPDKDPGKPLPDQKVWWQTDPLTETARRVCEGVVEPRFVPDEPDGLDGAWRCACGQVNLASAGKCGACGCAKSWLDTHLDRAYLEKRRAEFEEHAGKQHQRKKTKAGISLGDRAKAILIAASAAALVALIILTVSVIIPAVRYARADALAEEGEFDRAIGIFTDLGSYKDSEKRLADVIYRKAQAITGLEKVNMTTHEKSPWFLITEDGVLSFRKDDYEKANKNAPLRWQNFIVPDMVDGVIVRELDRNFFMNCKDLTSVTLTDCLEVLGEQTFYNCEALTAVSFGKNVRVIGPRAFVNCNALETLTIPDTVESLGFRAFNNCLNLKKVVLGKGITRVEEYTFSRCASLKSVTFSSPPSDIVGNAFSDCESLETIYCRFGESEWDPTFPEAGEADPLGGAALNFDN